MSEQSASGSRTVSPRLIGGVVLAVLAVIFVLQNTARGRVSFLFWHITAPSWTWLIVIFVVGVIVGSMFPWFRRRK